MTVDKDLQRFLNSLAEGNSLNGTSSLDPVASKTPITETVGRASNKANSASLAKSQTEDKSVMYEILSVYSVLLVTQDGAYELHPDWPTTGWPGAAIPLTPGTAYYEQKRVHKVVYYDGAKLHEENLLVSLEMPYEGGCYQGILKDSAFSASLHMDVTIPQDDNGKQLVAALVQTLSGAGVIAGRTFNALF